MFFSRDGTADRLTEDVRSHEGVDTPRAPATDPCGKVMADRSEGPPPATLVDMLRRRAKLRGDARVYSFVHDDGRRESLTFGELDRRARAIAQRLSAAVGPGDRVLLLHPPGLDYAIAFYGCLYAGCVAVPAFPPDDGRMRRGSERLS